MNTYKFIIRMSTVYGLVFVFMMSIATFTHSKGQKSSDDTIPAGYMIIEGDIIVPTDFYETLARSTWRPNSFWPDGIVPFRFDGNVNALNQTRMQAAMAEIERVSRVLFVVRTTEANFIHILDDPNVNSSAVGMQGGQQDVRIVSWNIRFIMVHELMHAVGFWHEQSRPNRDASIQINWGNIQQFGCPGCGGIGACDCNFQIQANAGEYGPYDYGSLMHYGQCDFSNCGTCNQNVDPTTCPTIVIWDTIDRANWQTMMGQRNNFSHFDSLTLGFIYQRETNWTFVSNQCTPDEQVGSFFSPYCNITDAINNSTTGSTIWITEPGTYTGPQIYNQQRIIRAPVGGVRLTR